MARKHTIIPLILLDLQQDGFHPLVEVSLSGRPFILVLDTGASKTAFDQALLEEANFGIEIVPSDSLSTGLGTNDMRSSTAVISSLCIGGRQIEKFEAAVLDLSAINIAYGQLGHARVLGVLGGDILVKYKALIDYGKLQLTLKK